MKIFGTLFLVFLFQFNASAGTPVDDVLKLSSAKNLSSSRAWTKLLHIERNVFGFRSSQITDPHFLFSKWSRYAGQDELFATLQAFTEPAQNYAKKIEHPLQKDSGVRVTDHSEHPICRFPARLKFLKSQLGEAQVYWNTLPDVNCVFQKIYLDALSPKSVSFVFSSYYSDSPGSAFGHTFFRINRQPAQSAVRQELLDYGVGFAANVTVSNLAAYALMGLVGGFTGSWINLPYYYKVREYNDFEARDLWSYDLDLTPDEVEMLSLHLWEVGSHYYTYYFFTQNCAFHMLTVLEAAAPRLHLIEHIPFLYVIPADSMKALFYEQGLVKNVSFRPSTRKVFLSRSTQLDHQASAEFKNFAKTESLPANLAKMNTANHALFLDAAIDLVDLRYPQIDPKKDIDLYQKKEDLLSKRAEINFVSPPLKISIDSQERPDQSHGSSRLALSYTDRNQLKSGFLNYRFALHDLQDPQFGMPKNSQLEFFNLSFQVLPNELKFQEINLFKVFNLSPVNFFESKPTWGFELGIQNKPACCPAENRDCLLNGFLAKYGKAISLLDENLISWAVVTINARYGATLPGSKAYVGPGYEVGLLGHLGSTASILATFGREYPNDQRPYEQNYIFEYRHALQNWLSFGGRVKNDVYGVIGYYYF